MSTTTRKSGSMASCRGQPAGRAPARSRGSICRIASCSPIPSPRATNSRSRSSRSTGRFRRHRQISSGFARRRSNSFANGVSARRIPDLDQIEAFGRRGRAAGTAIADRERAGHIVRTPPPETDQLQCADYVAHLVMQKRAGPRRDMDLGPGPVDFQRIERLQRRLSLTQRVAERGEIVMPDQVAGAGAHRLDVGGWSDLPYPTAFERRRGAAVEDAIEINPAERRQPGVELVANAPG